MRFIIHGQCVGFERPAEVPPEVEQHGRFRTAMGIRSYPNTPVFIGKAEQRGRSRTVTACVLFAEVFVMGQAPPARVKQPEKEGRR
jgi:hypothetical protein